MTESTSAPANPIDTEDTAHGSATPVSPAIQTPVETRHRWWIDFDIRGDLRFISHHDTLRLFRRAMARAELPVRFSEGFNPHPKMTIPLPRPLGVSSEAEAIVIELGGTFDPEELVDRLGKKMPEGVKLSGARLLADGERPQPDTVTYRFRPERDLPDDLAERIRRIVDATSLPVERVNNKTKRARTVDIRPYLLDLQGQDSGVVFTLRVTGTGTAKPGEIVGLLTDDTDPVNHRIHRVSVRWR